MMEARVITVDGPSASGKSTVARRVAARLGRLHVDSGALYRAVAWKMIAAGVSPADRPAVRALLAGLKLEMDAANGAVRFRLDGRDLGPEIRTPAVSAGASAAGLLPEVREWVNTALRRTPALGGVVMDGRDIGSVVFPGARHKFFLDADPETRARRRHAERTGGADSIDTVRADMARRDAQDRTRREAPLTAPAGAVVIDTTELDVDGVTQRVVRHIETGREAGDGV